MTVTSVSARDVTVGVCLPYSSPPAQYAALAEGLGYERLSYGEHLLFRRPILNAFVALASAAGATRQIKLLSALTLLPLYPPALAAKLAFSVDAIAPGRFELGVGVGGEVPEEFAAVDVDLATRGRRVDDTLRAIEELRTGVPSDGDPLGRAFHEWAPLMTPKPSAPIPLWVGGRSEAAIRRAARVGDVWLPYLVTAEQLARGVDEVNALSVEHGRPGAVTAAVTCFVFVSDDRVEARREGRAFVSRLYDLEADRVDRYVVAGTGDDVARRLAELVDAGATAVNLNFCAEGAAVEAMTRRAAAEVLPALTSSIDSGGPR